MRYSPKSSHVLNRRRVGRNGIDDPCPSWKRLGMSPISKKRKVFIALSIVVLYHPPLVDESSHLAPLVWGEPTHSSMNATWTHLLWIPNPTSRIFLITCPFVCWLLGGSFLRTASCSPSSTNYPPKNLLKQCHSGWEVHVTLSRAEIIVRPTHTQEVLGDKGPRIRGLTTLINKESNSVGHGGTICGQGSPRGLSEVARCETLRCKLLSGLAVRRYSFPRMFFRGETDELTVVLLTVFFDLLGSLVQRGARLLFQENFVPLVQSPWKSSMDDTLWSTITAPINSLTNLSASVNVFCFRSVILGIGRFITFSFVKASSASSWQSFATNCPAEMARYLFLTLFSSLSPRRLMRTRWGATECWCQSSSSWCPACCSWAARLWSTWLWVSAGGIAAAPDLHVENSGVNGKWCYHICSSVLRFWIESKYLSSMDFGQLQSPRASFDSGS